MVLLVRQERMTHVSPRDKPLYDLINGATTPQEGAYFCMFGQASTDDGVDDEHNNLFANVLPNLTALGIGPYMDKALEAGDQATVRFLDGGIGTEIYIRLGDDDEIGMNLLSFLGVANVLCDGTTGRALMWDPALSTEDIQVLPDAIIDIQAEGMSGRSAATIPLSDLPLLVAALKKWVIYTKRMAEL